MPKGNNRAAAVKTPTPAQVSADNKRAKLLADANDAFRSRYEEIREALASEETTIFETRYKIGLMVEEMSMDESSYGSKPVERMAELQGSGRDVIYQALLFVQRFDDAEMKELTKMRNKAGDPLLWTHVSHLIRIPDREVRQGTLRKCLELSWSPAELLAFIQNAKGGKTRSNAGKPLARPKSLRGFIDQQSTYIDQLLKRKEKVWAGQEKPGDTSFFDLLNSTPLTKLDTGTLTDLEKLEDRYELAATEMEAMATELSKIRRRIEDARDACVDNYQDDDEEPDEGVRPSGERLRADDDDDEEEDDEELDDVKLRDDEDEDEEEEEEEEEEEDDDFDTRGRRDLEEEEEMDDDDDDEEAAPRRRPATSGGIRRKF